MRNASMYNYMPVITINMSKLITKKILVYTKGVKCPSEQIGRILDVQHHPHVNVKDDLKAQFKQVQQQYKVMINISQRIMISPFLELSD